MTDAGCKRSNGRHSFGNPQSLMRRFQFSGSLLHEHFQMLSVPLQFFLRCFAIGYVPHDAGEDAAISQVRFAYRQLDWKCRTVLAPPLHFPLHADDFASSGPTIILQVLIMLIAIGRRHEQADIMSNDLFGAIAENSFSCLVEGIDSAAFVNGDDGINSSIDDGPQTAGAFPHSLF